MTATTARRTIHRECFAIFRSLPAYCSPTILFWCSVKAELAGRL